MSDRNVAPVVIQNPTEQNIPSTLSEKPSDKSNQKKTSVQAKVTNKKEDDKIDNKRSLQIDKVSKETLDFIEKVLK